MQLITQLFLQICLYLHGTRRRDALASLAVIRASFQFNYKNTGRTVRGPNVRMQRSVCRTDASIFFYTNHIVSPRNAVRPCVNFNSLATFKRSLKQVDLSNVLIQIL